MKDTTDLVNMTVFDLKTSNLDKENKILKHLSILSKNAHDSEGEVFRTFSDKALGQAVEVFEGSLARLDHDRAATESRGVRTGYGVYKNLVREGDMIFGDLHLWDCPEADKVMSIAERTPTAVGNSIHTGGIVKLENGIEIVEELKPRTRLGFKPSVDLVEDPACTIGLYNERRSKQNDKENTMEYKDITLDSLKSNRKDLYEAIRSEGFASRDSEVKTLTEERDDVSKKLDTIEVKLAASERSKTVEKLLADSELPDYAKTDTFRRQLMEVRESKDGDKVITVEERMKELIQDRLEATSQNGVHDIDEKDLHQSRSGGQTDPEKFASAFKAER